ncbi:MAG: hypothetical protein JWL70_736 [Acidimicrobiia bacterium]|nr:hypothetical protein [Acidimicrobiia bacterium]
MTPNSALSSWSWDLPVLVLLVATAGFYAVGSHRLLRLGRHRFVGRARWSFWAGWLLLVVALVSPLDVMSEALFSAHMTQHLILGLIAPLLLVAGHPIAIGSFALRPQERRAMRWWSRRLRLGELRQHPVAVGVVVVTLHLAAFWLWHLPASYDAAVRHNLLHAAEHATLFGTGLLLWAAIANSRAADRGVMAVVVLFVAGLGSGALAALLTLSPTVLYSVHANTTGAWHLTPLEDQQLAGAIMWVPGGLIYAVAALVSLVQWLDRPTPTRRPLVPALAGER